MLAEEYPQLRYISTSSETGLLTDVRTLLQQAAAAAAAAAADPSLPPSLPLSLPQALSHALASRICSHLALPPSLSPGLVLDGWPRSATDLEILEEGGREGGEGGREGGRGYVDACVFLDTGEEKEDPELVLLREGLKEGGREGGRACVVQTVVNEGTVDDVYQKVKEALAPVLEKGGAKEGGKGAAPSTPPPPAAAAKVPAAAATKTKAAAKPSSTILPFGGLLLPPPLSLALLRAGITQPTPIQEESFPQIMRGRHVLIHDETGSGKTLAFLLPLLLPLLPPPGEISQPSLPSSPPLLPRQLVIVCPTRELAVQVGRVVSDLLGGEGGREGGHVALLIEESREGTPPLLPSLPAPVLVGTAKVLWSEMVKANQTSLKTREGGREGWMGNVRAVVIDEVDRCLSPLGQYATLKEKKQKERHPKPAVLLLEEVMRRGGGREGGRVQFVGASATIGRPLRREVARCLGVDPKLDPPVVVRGGGREGGGVEEEGGKEGGRAVTVPKGIAHRYIAVPDEEVQGKLLAVRAYLMDKKPRRPLLFVPQQQYVQPVEGGGTGEGGASSVSVSEVVARLGRLVRGTEWEGRVKALHEEMGFGGGGREGGRAGKQVVDGRGGKKGRGMGGGKKEQEGEEGEEEEREGRRKVSDLLSLEDQVAGPLASTSSSLPPSSSALSFPLLVTSAETARGLDFGGECDCVLILGRAKSADEYQHVAGRTGRRGRDGGREGGREVKEGEGGVAVSVISYVDIKKLTGYESMLGIKFTRESGLVFD